jgi:methylmalonyl-CoA mutase
VIPLSEGFPAATSEAWLALVAKTLKGAGVESLVGRTADGLPIKPLYTADDASSPLPFTPAARPAGQSWDIRADVTGPDPAGANRAALDALAGGAASLLIRIDGGAGEGVRIDSAEGMARVLEGVMTDIAGVALDAGFLGPIAADWLGLSAKAAPTAPLAFHLDPLSSFAAAGTSPGPVEAHLAAAAAVGAGLAETYPKATLFLASGGRLHEAGGSPAWELGFAAAAAVAYAKALTSAGLAMEDALGRIVLGLAADAQPLGVIAKLRAARVLWGRITQACGVEAPARIEARSSRRMLTRADRWTNLVRLTSAGFGAAVGGADAIVLGAFTDAIAPPDAFALRLARNTQLILMEEAHLGKVADPAAGAWAMEAQTADLAHAAWQAFVAIEAAGGAAAALCAGVVAEAVAASRRTLADAIAARDLRLIGVTDFVAAEPAPEATPPAPWEGAPDARQPGPDSLCPPLTAIRLEEMAA